MVVDVGMNRTEAGLVGDVDPGAAEVAAFMTPVPGGVGPMTIACLLENAVQLRPLPPRRACLSRLIRWYLFARSAGWRACSHPSKE